MSALLTARLPAGTAHEAMVSGRRYGAREALAAGIVDETASEERVLEVAVQRAAALAGKSRSTVVAIKRGIYGDVVAALETGAPVPASRIAQAAATVRSLQAAAAGGSTVAGQRS
jgi:enoyl-CoA hydratase/carnithine racemase